MKVSKIMVELTGKKFNHLTVLKIHPNRDTTINKEILWECVCDCGNSFITTARNLVHGGNRSCGCINKVLVHGESRERIRRIWQSMKTRCRNSVGCYNGISICNEWQDYFEFKKWAYDNGYNDNLTIDRYPNKKGNYEPSNCRWASYKEQGNNRSVNHLILINGIDKTISEWAEDYKIHQCRIASRIRRGWNPVDAVITPIDTSKTNKRYLKCQ
jgi:hypothetical protein